MRNKLKILLMVAIAFVMTITTSCEKDNLCRVIVTAVDVNGTPISGVNIKLWVPNNSLEYPNQQTISWPEQTTGNNGQANFNFQNESVLEIEATKDILYGTGFVVLKQGILVSQEVILN